ERGAEERGVGGRRGGRGRGSPEHRAASGRGGGGRRTQDVDAPGPGGRPAPGGRSTAGRGGGAGARGWGGGAPASFRPAGGETAGGRSGLNFRAPGMSSDRRKPDLPSFTSRCALSPSSTSRTTPP